MNLTNIVTVEEIVHVHYGKGLRKADRNENGQCPVWASSGQIGFHNESLLTDETIIIGRKGSVGSVFHAPNGGWTIDTAFYLEPKYIEFEWRYLYYALVNANLARHTITTSIPGISRNDIYSTKIYLPPIKEQRHIANILDKADELRRKRQESLALMDELLRSVFLEMFGDPFASNERWSRVKLGDVAEDVQYGTSGKANIDQDGLPVLRMGNMTYHGRWLLDDMKWCPLNETEIEKYTVKCRDLLFNRTNSPNLVGKTAVWTYDESYAYAGYLIRVRFDLSQMLPEFASACLNSSSGKRFLLCTAKPSNNMSNFNASMLKDIELPCPPLSAQVRYLDVLNHVEEERGRCLRSLHQMDSLFATLTQQAFRGELTGDA